MIDQNMFSDYQGQEGGDPELFTNEQLQAIVRLLETMGIYRINLDPRVQKSDIHVRYVNPNADEPGSRLYWRN